MTFGPLKKMKNFARRVYAAAAVAAFICGPTIAQAQFASGGTESNITVGGQAYRVHTFTNGTSSLTVSQPISGVEVLIVAGGGGGGTDIYVGDATGRAGGGGGAGGLISQTGQSLAAGTYPIVVGAGGVGATASDNTDAGLGGQPGGDSSFNGQTAIGGGGGGGHGSDGTPVSGDDGGSGGGGNHSIGAGPAGAGTAGQGFNGGVGNNLDIGGGGGGAGGGGGTETAGAGLTYSITGSSVTYSQGGKGSNDATPGDAVSGAASTGQGGGASTAGGNNVNAPRQGGYGGSGIVIVRYEIADVTISGTTNGAEASTPTDGTFTISLSSAVGGDVVVSYTVADNSATAGADYTATAGIATITAGQTSVTINIPVLDDAALEGNEIVTASLTGIASGPGRLGSTTSSPITIIDDEMGLQASISTTINGAEAPTPTAGLFTVTLTMTDTVDNVIPYTVSGTATQGADHTLSNGTVTILAGQTIATIPVTIIDDALTEGTETIIVTLGTPTSGNALLGSASSATMNVTDDEALVELSVSVATQAAEPSTNGFFMLNLSQADSVDVVVPYTISGTATVGTDHSLVNGTATISAGQTSVLIAATVSDDTDVEGTETIVMTLGTPTAGNATLGAASAATMNLNDNDLPSTDAASENAVVAQAKQFATVANFTNTYLQSRLSATAADDSRTFILAKRRDGERTLYDWVAFGGTSVDMSGTLAGDGIFAYALRGADFVETPDSVVGYTLGFEYGDWRYDTESDIQKTGLSVGVYGGRNFDGVSLTTNATLTLFQNGLTRTGGATATAQSMRIATSWGINGIQEFDSGAYIKPYADMMYAYESIESYTYSDGINYGASSGDLGEVSLGLEYATAPTAIGTFTLRGELEQGFGSSDATVTLSNGTTYTPSDGVTAEIGLGWSSSNNSDTTRRVEFTLSEIGDSDVQEMRLDAAWDRNF